MNRATDGLDQARVRALGVLPPIAAWLIILAPVWGALIAPHLLGYFMIAFAGYWQWRCAEFAYGLVIGLLRLRSSQRRHWSEELRQLPGARRLRYALILPTYTESEDVLAATLERVAHQTVPLDSVAVVLACEERDDAAPARAEQLTRRFAPAFGYWLVTFHPALPGEVKGKSSNLAWAARRLQEELVDTGRIRADDLLVTVIDADSRLHRQYLAALGHAALSHPDGRLHLYQPALLFYANYWRLPLLLRAVGSIFSLYSLARLAVGHRLVPQSTYSLSWRVAQRVGYWDVDVLPEDSHMFFKVWLHFGRRVRVRPIYLPVQADAAEGPTPWRSMVSTYLQVRRWAWGVSDVPYIVLRATSARHIPWPIRLVRVWWYLEDHLTWPSHWFLLTFGSLVPRVINPEFAHTALGMWQTQAVSTLLGLTFPALVVGVAADMWLRPRSPQGQVLDMLAGAASLIGFVFLPLSGLAMSALPALDAHTRLLLGRSLAYEVTQKLPSRVGHPGTQHSALSTQHCIGASDLAV